MCVWWRVCLQYGEGEEWVGATDKKIYVRLPRAIHRNWTSMMKIKGRAKKHHDALLHIGEGVEDASSFMQVCRPEVGGVYVFFSFLRCPGRMCADPP